MQWMNGKELNHQYRLRLIQFYKYLETWVYFNLIKLILLFFITVMGQFYTNFHIFLFFFEFIG